MSTRAGRSAVPARAEFASTWRTWLPFSFVIFALLATLLLPILLEGRVRRLRYDATALVGPARTTLSRLELSFARQAIAVRNLLLSGDSRQRYVLQSLREEEARSFQSLDSLTSSLGSGPTGALQDVRALAEQWHVAHSALLEARPAGEPLERPPPEEPELEPVLQAISALDRELYGLGTLRRAEARRLEQMRLGLSAGLSLLAIAAVLVVGWSGQRFRRRAREERQLREAALALTAAVQMEDVLHRVVVAAAEVDRGSSAYLERIDSTRTEVEVVAATGSLAPAPGTRAIYPGSLTAAAIESGTPEIVHDTSREARPMMRHLTAAGGRLSAVAIPLLADASAQGALILLRHPEQRRFCPRNIESLRVFGALAALALRKALLLEQSEQRLAHLLRANELRARLLRGFSHDIKNPLGAADGYAALLQEGIGDEARRRESVGRIRKSIGTALSLIDNLVELARAEAGQLPINYRVVDLHALTSSIADEFRGAAGAAGLSLEHRTAPDLSTVETDPDRVRQILANLLSNAIKYTPRGGRVMLEVTARTGRRGRDPAGWLMLAVHDTGPGIPEAERNNVFREFARLEQNAAPGSGLGLAISQGLANLLGGEISLTSEVGVGSTFSLWIPHDCSEDRDAHGGEVAGGRPSPRR